MKLAHITRSRDLADLSSRIKGQDISPEDQAVIQKLLNASKRVLEFDIQIGGPNKAALARARANSSQIEWDLALKIRRHLIRRRFEMVEFIREHGFNVPTTGL